MSYGLSLAVPPAIEPIELSRIKSHLRLTEDDDDVYLDEILLPAARWRAENATRRQLLTATWLMTLDAFPIRCRSTVEYYRERGLAVQFGEEIILPRSPVQSVTSIEYTDPDGNDQTWAAADYVVSTDREPATIRPAFNIDWPDIRLTRGAIRITFVAGYGAARSAVPPLLIAGLLLVIGHWYEHREEVVQGTMSVVPQAAEAIFTQFAVGDDFHEYG